MNQFPIRISFAVTLCAVVLCAGCTSENGGPLQVTGQIEGQSVAAGSRVGGRISEVFVEEGDSVTKGQLLIQIEDAEAQAMVASAEALLAQTEAALMKLEAGARPEQLQQAKAAVEEAQQRYQMALQGARSQEIAAARGAVDTAKAQLTQAEKEFERQKSLFDQGGTAQRLLDSAEHGVAAAKGVHRSAVEQLDLLVQGTRDEQISVAKAILDRATAAFEELENGAREEDRAAAKATRDAASAEVDRANTVLREMKVEAPMDGVVESLDVLPGDIVRPGPIIEIVDPDDLELKVYVSAAYLGHIRLGQAIELTTDSHGDRVFRGSIRHIATVGEFTPRNLQTEEERVQQVFGITISLTSEEGALRAGMSATAHVAGVDASEDS